MIEGKILVSKGKTWATKGKNCVIEGKSSHASSSDKNHTDWAKPNQLPAGPREKRPIGRLFSSNLIIRIMEDIIIYFLFCKIIMLSNFSEFFSVTTKCWTPP